MIAEVTQKQKGVEKKKAVKSWGRRLEVPIVCYPQVIDYAHLFRTCFQHDSSMERKERVDSYIRPLCTKHFYLNRNGPLFPCMVVKIEE
ncbi:hypothetical protein NPIL_591981 [Nephila pilipes]|uniref:Uncharacterized protein n=1 Tax=Nephila pilipes TaxID=299642 RepID=A0A8X6PLS3_NEPPI|nr:hypothetical protein NPIL_591981 [Nephila pilipes]